MSESHQQPKLRSRARIGSLHALLGLIGSAALIQPHQGPLPRPGRRPSSGWRPARPSTMKAKRARRKARNLMAYRSRRSNRLRAR